MIIYNVTLNVNHEVHDEWVTWMKEIHIPHVMSTGLFTGHTFLKLLGDHDTGGVTYAVQYRCNSMDDYNTYNEKFAPALRQEGLAKFPDQFTAFRTLLETV